jgi:hypothetical protein
MEFEAEDVGIEKFPDGVGSLGFLDWGDFANLRYFDASPGLLYSGSDFGRFSVIEISRKPGSHQKHIRGIERRVIHPQSIPSINIPPPPDPPPVDPPPTIDPPPTVTSGEPLCSAVTFLFGVESDAGCISRVEFYIDGMLKQTSPGFTNLPGRIVACPPFFVDTTTMANGLHQICVKVYPCNGSPVMNCWNFVVSNPCGVVKPPLHL